MERKGNQNRETMIVLTRQHTTYLNINSWTLFSGWHQQIYLSEPMTFLCNRGQYVHPKKLPSHILDLFCQEPKVSSIPYAFHNLAAPALGIPKGCFWQADVYPAYYLLEPQHGWTIESDLVGSWMATQEITSRVPFLKNTWVRNVSPWSSTCLHVRLLGSVPSFKFKKKILLFYNFFQKVWDMELLMNII